MPLGAPSFPVSLVVAGRPCLVVGGGRVAARKVDALARSEAHVTVVAPEVDDAILRCGVQVEHRAYEAGEAARYRLVITATGLPEVDRQVAADAEAAVVFVNAADDTEACSFVLPAVLRRGTVSVAVSTDGASPALAAWLRDRVAGLVGPELEAVAVLLARARATLRGGGHSTEGLDWRSLLDAGLGDLVAAGSEREAEDVVRRWVASCLAERGGGGSVPVDPPDAGSMRGA